MLAAFQMEHGTEGDSMNTTGGYRIVPFCFLEGSWFEVRFLNIHHVNNVPCRKRTTRTASCCGRRPPAVLHRSASCRRGVLRAEEDAHAAGHPRPSEVPGDHPDNQVPRDGGTVNANLDRAFVGEAGKTGMAIIDAIICGERDLLKLTP